MIKLLPRPSCVRQLNQLTSISQRELQRRTSCPQRTALFSSFQFEYSVFSFHQPAFTWSRKSYLRHLHKDTSLNKDTKITGEDCQEEEMSKPKLSDKLKNAKAEAVWGLFIADAISMPVHWYYNPDDIASDYNGWLTGYVAPNSNHPSSIIRLSAVDGSGRGSTSSSNSLIGNVILHDKLKYWNGSSSNNHYHQGMKAGDNTLNSVMALRMLQTMNKVDKDMVKDDREVRAAVLK